VSSLNANSQCGDHARQFPGCTEGLRGPSTHFTLDLRAATVPTPIAIVIDADFSFEAVLARGPCADNVLESCATRLQTDGRSRALSATLSPGYYELVVTGAGETDQGVVHVAASVGPNTCVAPVNDACDAGLAFDPSSTTQTVISNGACTSLAMPIRCGQQPIGGVFYDLDLSRRAAPTLLDVDVSKFSSRGPAAFAALYSATESGCGEFDMCGSSFSSRLAPGRYRIGVSQASDDRTDTPLPVAVRVRLREADCAATTNDTWQTAIELDPNAARQRLSGNTACGNNDFSAACNADRGAPELFYRLDLRNQPGPRQLYFSGQLDSELVTYLLLPDAAGVPSRVAGCDRNLNYFYVAPALYYFVIDGRVANAGRFDLELEQSDAYPLPQNCYSGDVLDCVEESEPSCVDSRASAECLRTALVCGFNPAAYDAFCARFPGCCDGTADPTECRTAVSSNLECN
jgi:hypothetical protein